MIYVQIMIELHCLSINGFCKMSGLYRDHFYRLKNRQNKPSQRTIKILAQSLQRLDGIDWLQHAAAIKQEYQNE